MTESAVELVTPRLEDHEVQGHHEDQVGDADASGQLLGGLVRRVADGWLDQEQGMMESLVGNKACRLRWRVDLFCY